MIIEYFVRESVSSWVVFDRVELLMPYCVWKFWNVLYWGRLEWQKKVFQWSLDATL